MNGFRILFLINILVLLSHNLYSQVLKDSISKKAMSYVADKFPIARALNVEYQQSTPYDFSTKAFGNNLPDGKVDNIYQFKTSANFNFIQKRNWIVGTTLTYRFISLDVEKPDASQTIDYKENFHYHSQSLNLTHISKFFGKTALYTASLITDGSQEHFHERLRGMVTGTVVLKATRETQMTIGLIGFIDPSTLFPIFPSFTYKRMLQKGWTLDVVLPQGIYVRKNISENGRFSLGSEMGNTFFYLYNLDNTGRTYALNQTEINSGLIYEHYFGKSFIATVKTGLKNIPNSRVFEKSSSQSNYIIQASPEASFYINAGISFNPFGKWGKR